MALNKNRTKNWPAILLLVAVTWSLFACSNDDDSDGPACTNTPIAFTDLEKQYGCTNTKREMDINLNDTFVIISSQEAFNALVTGTCTPQIDFGTYDLIIGKQFLSSGNDSIEYELVDVCDSDDILLTVTFNQNNTSEAPNLTYHLLAPKLESPENLEVEILIN
ncbi:MAG: hypothetical protein CMC08_00010 [Flavobacteriaceae bacterium]|nr:hypothetical protein [Flavobacteriaceae bacterium]